MRGYNIVMEAKSLHPCADCIKFHHKYYDGSGYPEGDEAGDQIPLGARIIAVADAYDAMTTSRPYRKNMSHEAAVKELIEHRGQQWDPYLVSAFIDVVAVPRNTTKYSIPKFPRD